MITQKELLNLFDYKDGGLYYKDRFMSRGRPSVRNGEKIGSKMSNGYLNVALNKKKYLIHRLIFLYHYGYLPKFIDHIDGNPANNTIENLREATMAQNMCNTKIRIDNTSGTKGIHFNKQKKKWQSKLWVRGKQIARVFESKELALDFMGLFREMAHGQFAKH
jgi:hypothetical protein